MKLILMQLPPTSNYFQSLGSNIVYFTLADCPGREIYMKLLSRTDVSVWNKAEKVGMYIAKADKHEMFVPVTGRCDGSRS